jgi:hypothetical protein
MLSAALFLLGSALVTAREGDGQPLAFTHVTVIDATGAAPLPDMTVVVENQHIVTLGKSRLVRPRMARASSKPGANT